MNELKSILGFLFVVCLFINCSETTKESVAPDGFQIPAGFELELIASEPLVSDPVDMAIDEDGTLMVVEMHGYPLDLSGSGVVRQLIDTDDDGKLDKSIVFADGLVLPTGIMKWKSGWIVTDPPNVLFLEDTNLDGLADIRDTLLTGFARSNPQHNVNSPVFGLDNWIYLSHEGSIQTKLFNDILGDAGEEVHYYGKADGPRLARNADGLAVRFKPDSYQLENLSSRGQFGHTFDDWGHHFVSSNADHLYHNVLDAKYVRRNKQLSLSSSRHYMPSTGKGFEIYPITTSPEHQLLTDMGVITSACGTMWYNGGLLPDKYANTIFTAEPVHNLIHLDNIEDDGATFTSVNFFDDKEFVASTDSWFRPVNHYIGPDGAVYIVDYYRKVIEHPEWLSDEVTQSDDLTSGTDKGRIYRLVPSGTQPMAIGEKISLGDYTIDQLIESLAHENIWWRNHAQRLLMDQKESISIDQLREFLQNTNSPQGKVHAAWILEGLQQMNAKNLIALLKDSHPGVRENALKISEHHIETIPDLLERLLSMVDDSDPKVRFQLLLVLGNYNESKAVVARNNLLAREITDPWVQIAALTAKDLDYTELYTWASEALINNQNQQTADFFSRISEMIIRNSSADQVNTFINKVSTKERKRWYQSTVLSSISKALGYKSNFALSKSNEQLIQNNLSEEQNQDSRRAMIELLAATDYFKNDQNQLVKNAKQLLLTNASDSETAICEAINILGKAADIKLFPLLSNTFINSNAPNIRLACLDAFKSSSLLDVSNLFLDQWKELTSGERKKSDSLFPKGQ